MASSLFDQTLPIYKFTYSSIQEFVLKINDEHEGNGEKSVVKESVKAHSYAFRINVLLIFAIFLCCHQLCHSQQKLRYALGDECDRYSPDAMYHEKYKPITNNIFADMKEFMGRVSDLVADSLTTIMADLPDRDVSTNEERRVHGQFKNLKSALWSRIKKQQRNITTAWEDLLVSHFDLMFDNKNASLHDYMNKTLRMTESYSSARRALDTILSTFIKFMRGTVGNGIGGIKAASQDALKKEEEERKKKEEDNKKEDNKSQEEVLREKMVEITKSIVPGFLGNLTVHVIERRLDVDSKKSGIDDPDSRDSVLDDIVFDMLMAKNRIKALVQLDTPKDKGEVNLARRSIYTYWAGLAEEMYKERIRARKTTPADDSKSTGRLFYRNLWKDEKQLLDTMLDLLEIYP